LDLQVTRIALLPLIATFLNSFCKTV